ncbi:MAG: hypothetical protein K2W82_01550 [Candidatus Obscuribacterales bacterium]|nr:hypothetical protein [Candidatus Obscuribacterales bacterium]
MRRNLSRFSFALFVALAAMCTPQNTQAESVYANLQRSRDALLAQQAELQRAYDDTRRQIDSLNGRLTRIDSYQRQINSALRDVEDVMRNTR